MGLRIASVTIDCQSPRRMADFWSAALGYRISDCSDSAATAEDPRDRDVELVFVLVPEGKTAKNRVHLDIGADNREAEVQRLIGLGAEVDHALERWTVMRDPEGNEFCILDVAKDDPIEEWRT